MEAKIEKIISDFELNDDEKVNYKDLTIALTVLDSANWLKKYNLSQNQSSDNPLEEVHRKIEEHIKNHLKNIIKPLESLNFSYESEERKNNIKAIKALYEKLQDIAPLDKRFEGLAILRKAAEEKLLKSLDSEIEKIKEEFSFDKVKIIAENSILRLTLKTEKILKYLESLNELDLTKDSRKTLKKQVDDFYILLEKEIIDALDKSLQNIKKFSEEIAGNTSNNEESQKTKLNKDVDNFLKGYQNTKLIQNILSKLNIPTEEGKNWIGDLKEFAFFLDTEMGTAVSLNKIATLNAQIFLCKCLIPLDNFLENTSLFQDLFRRFSNQIMTDNTANIKELYKLIDNVDFKELLEQVDELKKDNTMISQNKIKRMKSYFENIFNQLQEEIKQKIRTMGMKKPDVKTYQEVVSKIKKWENIKLFNVVNVFDVDEILKFIREIKYKNLNNLLIKYIENICNLIDNYEYESVEIEELNLNVLLEIFNPEVDSLDNSCGPLELQKNITETYSNVDKKIREIGETLIKKYNSIEDIKLNSPKELCSRLEKSSKFRGISNDVQKKLALILTEKIEKIEKDEKLSINQKKNEFNTLLKNLKYIPNGVALTYTDTITEKLNGITEESLNFTSEVNLSIEMRNHGGVLNHINKIKNGKGSTEHIIPIKLYINRISKEYLEEAKKEISVNEVNEIDNTKKFIEFFDLFSKTDFDSELKTHLRDLENVFQKKLNEYLYNASLMFQRKKPKNDSDQGSEKANEINYGDDNYTKEEKAIRIIFDKFLNLSPGSFRHIFPKFLERFHHILKKFYENLKYCEDTFQASFEENFILKFEGLREVLYNMKQWDFFFKNNNPESLRSKLKLIDTDSSNLELEESLKKGFEEVYSGFCKVLRFDDALNFVKEKVKLAYTNILKVDMRKKYKDIQERTLTFKNLHNYLKSISEFSNEESLSAFCSKKDTQEFIRMSNEAKEYIKNSISDIVSDIIDFIEEERLTTNEDCENLNNIQVNFETFMQHSEDLNMVDLKEKDSLNSKFMGYLDKLFNEAIDNIDSPELLAESLVDLKRIEIYVRWKKPETNKHLNNILAQFKTKHKFTGLGKLGTCLNQLTIGKNIIQDHIIFEGYNTAKFNRNTQTHDITYVLKNIKGTNINKDLLKSRFEEFEKFNKETLENYLKPDMNFDNLVENIVSTASSAKLEFSKEINKYQWSIKHSDDLPKLLGWVFGLWTLTNAGNYFACKDEKENKDYLYLPHPGQVISIFRLLGIGNDNDSLLNNLVQVGTGEGKSIILGITSIILSLYGFEVYSACYSNYLSERDFNAFLPLFQKLKVDPFIKYGTFNLLSEKIINENGDIRKLVENMIKPDPDYKKNDEARVPRPKMLLVDEVDVFFSPDFYGNVYTPAAVIRDETITNLIQYIWNRRGDPKLGFHNIESTSEYNECKTFFKNYHYILDEAIKEMVRDVINFSSPHYECKNGKIGYKEQDDYSFNVIYGYKTLFAYYHEHSQGKVDIDTLRHNSYIRINVGYFSYAEIPLKFQYIIGVTGTLQNLSTAEEKVVREKYMIKNKTFCPSVFGDNNLKFTKTSDDIYIEKDYENFYLRISDEIKRVFEKRAVLVFFENEEKIKNFMNSKKIDVNINYIINTLTEKDDAEDKTKKIKTASNKGNVTLLTKAFGRGTDFISNDDDVNKNGGVHVIQTFLSDQESEEVQIRGRTARQGQQGSFCLIIYKPSLERFSKKLEEEELNELTNVYFKLNSSRNKYFEDIYSSKSKFIMQTEKEHKLTEEFYESVKKGETDKIKQYILSKNSAPVANIRIMVLLDGTGSMGGLLEKCKNNICVMFDRARVVLHENKCDPNCFQMQLCIYRDYDCKRDEILKVSNWETIPERLREFMVKISAFGGGDYEEAIEIALQHTYKEHCRFSVSQVILIADAPAKSLEQVKEYRKIYDGGEQTWLKMFGEATYYKNELIKFNSHNPKLSVNTFYLRQNKCEENFKEIAEITNGKSKHLQIDAEDGDQTLINFITEEILASVGKEKGNTDQLINSYREKYPSHI